MVDIVVCPWSDSSLELRKRNSQKLLGAMLSLIISDHLDGLDHRVDKNRYVDTGSSHPRPSQV